MTGNHYAACCFIAIIGIGFIGVDATATYIVSHAPGLASEFASGVSYAEMIVWFVVAASAFQAVGIVLLQWLTGTKLKMD